MSTVEDKIREELRGELREVNQHSLQQPTLSPPSRRMAGPRRGMVIGVVAAVVAVTLAASISISALVTQQPADTNTAASSPTTAATTPTPAVTVSADTIRVQGAIIPVPRGWHAHQLANRSAGYRFCVLPRDQVFNSVGCLRSAGILIRVARVIPGAQTEPLPGSFQARCGAAETVPKLKRASVGGRPGNRIAVTCTSSPGPDSTPSTLYWQLADRTLTIQSPFDGTAIDTAKRLVQRIDLSRWVHSPRVGAAPTLSSTTPATSR